jgi:hypothetical protein
MKYVSAINNFKPGHSSRSLVAVLTDLQEHTQLRQQNTEILKPPWTLVE